VPDIPPELEQPLAIIKFDGELTAEQVAEFRTRLHEAMADRWDDARDRATWENQAWAAGAAAALRSCDGSEGDLLKVAYAQGASNERERLAALMDDLAANWPIDAYPPISDDRTSGSLSGAAMRHAYRNAARTIRESALEETA
jgi:hypothetical protein